MVRADCDLNRVVMMGSDFYESEPPPNGTPPLGIGAGSKIDNAIIDKNARIGKACTLSPEGKLDHLDNDPIYIRDGIVIVSRNAVVPDRTVF